MKRTSLTMAAMAVVVAVTLVGCGTATVPGFKEGKTLVASTTPSADATTSTEALATARLMHSGSRWEVSWQKNAEAVINVRRSGDGKIKLDYSWAGQEMGQGSITVNADILPDGRIEWGQSTGYHFILTPKGDGTFDIWTENRTGVYRGILRRKT